MLLTRSEGLTLIGLALAAGFAAGVPTRLSASESRVGQAPAAPRSLTAPAAPASQAAGATHRVVSSEITVSGEEAVMQLGFDDGRQMEFAIRDGRMFADGANLGAAPRNSAGERAWRELLTRVMSAPTPQVAGLVRSWAAPAPDGALKSAIVAALSGVSAPATPLAAAPGVGPDADTLAKLESRLEEMQQRLEQLQDRRGVRAERDEGSGSWAGPFRYIWQGISGIIATLVAFAILFALSIGVVFFGGRPYLEAVSDAARRQTTRSWVVGLAASFLVVPAFVLGILVLTISIVGIPVLLVFVPLFPVAVILGALFGYLGVAHGAGEALAERRLYGGEWFRRGNSYYFLMTGLGMLMALFLASHVVAMAGPWLGFLRGLLRFLAVVTTWFAFTTGLGAVLLTRGGRRPITGMAPLDTEMSGAYEEESRV
jgi:hypothetical protein